MLKLAVFLSAGFATVHFVAWRGLKVDRTRLEGWLRTAKRSIEEDDIEAVFVGGLPASRGANVGACSEVLELSLDWGARSWHEFPVRWLQGYAARLWQGA